MPPPEQPNEAYYVGVFASGGDRRVFLLEKTHDARLAVLVEWTRTQRLNYGMGLPVENGLTVTSFASTVVNIIENGMSPKLTIPRAPIFCTSIDEFAARSSLDLKFLETRIRRASPVPPGSVESGVDEQLEQPAQSFSPDTSSLATDSASQRKPWWQFWR